MSKRIDRILPIQSILALALSLAATVQAQAQAQDQATAADRSAIHVDALLQNVLVLRNDGDFDRTDPIYNDNGQSVGAVVTVFKPRLLWPIRDNLRLIYEAEIGVNYWSRNSPDASFSREDLGEANTPSPDILMMKHKELYGEGTLQNDRLDFRVGYGHIADPTGLFVNHWIGMGQVGWTFGGVHRLGLFAGQVPDQIYEGIDLAHNNFKRDTFVGGLTADLQLSNDWKLSLALGSLYDSPAPRRDRWLVAPTAQLEGLLGSVECSLGGLLQAGQFQGAAIDGQDQTLLAWAAQAHARWARAGFSVDGNVLALSPDDLYTGNGFEGAPLYSGKSGSATLIFTEDEIRDWNDNLDERMSRFEGGFFLNRAGLLVVDVKGAYAFTERFSTALIVGLASTLKPENSLGSGFGGVETDVVLEYRIAQGLRATWVATAVLPGQATSSLINRIDPSSTAMLWATEGSLSFIY